MLNQPLADPKQTLERTSFQTSAVWTPELQLGSDAAMCYGIDPTLAERIASWKAQGYRVQCDDRRVVGRISRLPIWPF